MDRDTPADLAAVGTAVRDPTYRRAPRTGSVWRRRTRLILSGIAAAALLLSAACDSLWVSLARPLDPVRIYGVLTQLEPHCVGGKFECGHLSVDRFCYRISPADFRPTLPDLSSHVGRYVEFTVDRLAYNSSRWVGDPMCNFQVAGIVLAVRGRWMHYSTAAMIEPQFSGHARSELIRSAVIDVALLMLLVAWNAAIEVRRIARLRAEQGRPFQMSPTFGALTVAAGMLVVFLAPILFAVQSSGGLYIPTAFFLALAYFLRSILLELGIVRPSRTGSLQVEVDRDLVSLNLSAPARGGDPSPLDTHARLK